MAGKRSATWELNHDNWNDEEAPEEAGTFNQASEDVIKNRVIKSARRRMVNSGDGSTKVASGAFTGFKLTTTASASPFSFLSNSNTKISGELQSTTSSASNGSANGSEAKNSQSKLETGLKSTETKQSISKDDGKISKKSTDYYAKLKGLNESVTHWIKSHVDSNPFCILTPIFNDYEKYLKEIEAKHGQDKVQAIDKPGQKSATPESSPVKKKPNSTSVASGETSKEKSVFGSQSSGNVESKTTESSIFGNTNTGKSIFGNKEQNTEFKSIFGNVSNETNLNPFLGQSSFSANEDKKKDSQADSNDKKIVPSLSFPKSVPTATFSFGQSSVTSSDSAGFSFGGGKPFSFGNVAKTGETEETKEDEDKDEDDEPPKVEFKPVTEEGAIYEKRCKVFVKKDNNFSDRGVGTLFLKPTPNEKTQLIVRADTSCGNLLLNTILNESIRTQRMGKNNVMMVLLPTPDSKPPPVPVLLRVKTSDDADALLEVLNKHKK